MKPKSKMTRDQTFPICRVCESIYDDKFLKVKEMMFGTGDVFDYFRCGVCGCLQIKNIPAEMSKYYSGEYYTGNREIKAQSSIKKFINRQRSRLARSPLYGFYSFFADYAIERWIHITKVKIDSRILDVGCGGGDLLYNFHNYGFRNLTGIDPYLKNSAETAGINFSNKELSESEGEFDMIIFNHSFEHIPDQLNALKHALNRLAGGGVIFIRMPVVNYAYEKYKENWVQLDAPRHIVLHSEKSLEHLCNRAGLKIEQVSYDSTEFQFMGSKQYKKGITLNSERSYTVNFDKSIFSKEDIKKYSQEARRLNKEKKGDQAAFVLKLNEQTG